MSLYYSEIQKYFRNQSKQLLSASEASIVAHPSLSGSHRENLIQEYLKKVLPKRFTIGHGVVYGQYSNSKECDIVIWDALNYPTIPLHGHNFFFVESVKLSLEIKTRWSSDNMKDVLEKSHSVICIPKMQAPNLVDTIVHLKHQMEAFRHGEYLEGMLISQHRVATGAIFLHGGENFNFNTVTDGIDIDNSWPDLLLLLDSGQVVIKHYKFEDVEKDGEIYTAEVGYLEYWNCGRDALILFTTALLSSITERSTQIEDPLYLTKYIHPFFEENKPIRIDFKLTRPIPHRQPIWD